MRGPSGQGASRLARARWPLKIFHETRNTAFMLFTNHGLYRRPNHGACRQVTVSLFTIVHDCSPLFGMVQQKNIVPEPVSVPAALAVAAAAPCAGSAAFGFSRNTKHETRITAFLPRRQTADARSRQVRGLQGGRYEARENEWKEVFSESQDRNYDFFRISIRFKIRNSPLFVGIRRKDSDKPLPPVKRPRALRQAGSPW